MKPSWKTALRLYSNRRFDLALKELLSLGVDPSEDCEHAYYLGLCHTQLKRYDDALIYLEQVVTASNNLLHIYQSRMILSYIYSITGRHRLAEFELNSLLESGYESAQVYAAYGYTAFAGGRVDDAITYLEKALGIDPDNPNALNSLGYILAEVGKDPKRGLDLCRKAVAQKPENPAYLDSLGWAYYKMGDLREARVQLRKALNLASGNKEIAAHMKAAMNVGKEE